MSHLLVVGSIAYDSVQTPFGMTEETLGGSATFFSLAASHLANVRLVGVVGEDFKDEYVQWLRGRKIDLGGLQRVRGKTFRWSGRYEGDMNSAQTLSVDLNVFGEFNPVLPEAYRQSEYVFLANGHPDLQMKVLGQVKKPKLIMADTMNLWIDTTRDALLRMLSQVDGLIINDGEARQLTGEHLTVAAGKRIAEMGPKILVVKKGEHGALLFFNGDVFAIPAYPLEQVQDPTGAGDSFAGGFMGYLARSGELTPAALKRALIYGTVMASFTVEKFSVNRLLEIQAADVEARAREFMKILSF